MKSTMRPIHSLIDENLLNRAQNIQSLTSSLHSRLSTELRQHCWIVNVIGNTLVLITDSAERATILRYQQHELLKQLNEEFSRSLEIPIRRLKIKIDYNLNKLTASKASGCKRHPADIDRARRHCQQLLKSLH